MHHKNWWIWRIMASFCCSWKFMLLFLEYFSVLFWCWLCSQVYLLCSVSLFLSTLFLQQARDIWYLLYSACLTPNIRLKRLKASRRRKIPTMRLLKIAFVALSRWCLIKLFGVQQLFGIIYKCCLFSLLQLPSRAIKTSVHRLLVPNGPHTEHKVETWVQKHLLTMSNWNLFLGFWVKMSVFNCWECY